MQFAPLAAVAVDLNLLRIVGCQAGPKWQDIFRPNFSMDRVVGQINKNGAVPSLLPDPRGREIKVHQDLDIHVSPTSAILFLSMDVNSDYSLLMILIKNTSII